MNRRDIASSWILVAAMLVGIGLGAIVEAAAHGARQASAVGDAVIVLALQELR